MPPLNEGMAGYAAGNKINIRRTVTGVLDGRTVIKAWLTVKNILSEADPGLVQKVITSSAVGGVGQITNPGSGSAPNRVAEVFFELTEVDTGTTLGPGKRFLFDIQLKWDNAEISTLSFGEMVFRKRVTQALS